MHCMRDCINCNSALMCNSARNSACIYIHAYAYLFVFFGKWLRNSRYSCQICSEQIEHYLSLIVTLKLHPRNSRNRDLQEILCLYAAEEVFIYCMIFSLAFWIAKDAILDYQNLIQLLTDSGYIDKICIQKGLFYMCWVVASYKRVFTSFIVFAILQAYLSLKSIKEWED